MGYDDVVPLVGGFGRYQKRIYFLLCLPAILCAFHKLGNVFLIAEPNYRCQLPDELPNSSYQLTPEEWKTNYPWNDLQKRYSTCSIIVNNATEQCKHFIFDEDVYGYTAVTEWELTCEQTYLIAAGNSLFMIGVMIGSVVLGELSDRYGRKTIFFSSLVFQVIFGVLAAISPEFWTFTISRAVIGATTSGVFLVAYVIALEMVGPKDRLIAGTVVHMFFSAGYMLTAVFAYYIHDWRSLQFALTIPGAIFLSYWWFVPESARWLITKNRITEAKKLIQVAAKSNKITLSDETLDSLLVSDTKSKDTEEKKASILDIFKYPNLRKRSLIIFFDWFANSITYYGLSWNTNNLAGNPYLNFIISGAVELPAYTFLILTLNRWGRKFNMCGCMILAGISLLLTMAVPDGHEWLMVTLAMIGKLAITASYGIIYIFSTEQFPTVIRNAGLGAGSFSARLGSILAPYINALNRIWTPFPLIIFGSISLLGGIASLILPETLNKQLPETIAEGEMFGRKIKGSPEDGKTNGEANGEVQLKLINGTS